MTRALRFAAIIAVVAWTAGPALAQVSISIISTPANADTYGLGETITTRMNIPRLAAGNPASARMKLDIGSVKREARSTTSFFANITAIHFCYTTVAGDADGIAIKTNSITNTGTWRPAAPTASSTAATAL